MQLSRDAPAWHLAQPLQDAWPLAEYWREQQGVRKCVPLGQAELVLREERKAQVLPLQEQQSWEPEVLSGRPAPLREPEAPALTVLHWVRQGQRVSPPQEEH